MDTSQPIPRPMDCPDCGAPFPDVGLSCWLCGWKSDHPLADRPMQQGPSEENPHASPNPPNRGNLNWTFSLSTLFLWTALVAVVMGVVRIAPPLGIALGVVSIPAALHTFGVAAYRKSRSGRALTLPDKILAFIGSFALFFLIAIATLIAALGALMVICTVVPVGTLGMRPDEIPDQLSLPVFAVAGLTFVGIGVYSLVRNLQRSKD